MRGWLRKFIQIQCLIFILVLTACESNATNDVKKTIEPVVPVKNISPEIDANVKIGFSMDTLEEERWPRDREFFKAAVEKLGAEVIISEAQGDDALQIVQAEQLINKGIDLLVIVPHNAEAVGTIVKKAQTAGIPVISYDRLVMNANVDLYISFDNELVGELQAKMLTEQVPKGKYVFIGGAKTDNNAHLLKKGAFKVLQPYINRGDIEIVYDEWTENWNPQNARANMEEALQINRNDIDAVIAANDATAGGVIEAINAQNLQGKIQVAGQDADLAAAQRIISGEQTMTVYKPIQTLAEEAANVAMQMAKGQAIDTKHQINNGKLEIPALLLMPIAVNRANIDDTIIADQFHTKEEVYLNTE